MKQSLLHIDAEFCNQYKGLLEIQRNIYEDLKVYSFDLNKDEITQAVIQRMNSFWYFHINNNKGILNRQVNTVAADFFNETCLLFIKSFFIKFEIEVSSERNILKTKSKKSIRPDLSLWKNEELIAVIELKVSDGWNRKNMLNHLEERKKSIQAEWPNVYFGAISYWSFSNIDDFLYPDYIGLLIHKGEKENHLHTGKTIEQIFKRILDVKKIYRKES